VKPRLSSSLGGLQFELGRALTSQVAPEEEPFYDEIVFASTKASTPAKDRTLGFGVSLGDIGVASGVLFALSKPILDFIWDNAKDAAGDFIKDETGAINTSFAKDGETK